MKKGKFVAQKFKLRKNGARKSRDQKANKRQWESDKKTFIQEKR